MCITMYIGNVLSDLRNAPIKIIAKNCLTHVTTLNH